MYGFVTILTYWPYLTTSSPSSSTFYKNTTDLPHGPLSLTDVVQAYASSLEIILSPVSNTKNPFVFLFINKI